MVAKIAVAAAIYAIDRPYSYRIPDGMTVEPGSRVMVPFGKGSKKTEGIVLEVTGEDGLELKVIDRCLDESAVLDRGALRVAAFIRERYFCTFYEAVRVMLPAGLWFRAVERYKLLSSSDWRESVREDSISWRVLEQLESVGGEADYNWLRQQFSDEDALKSTIHRLQGKKLISGTLDMLRRVGDKTERIANLIVSPEEAAAAAEKKRRSAPLQSAVLELLHVIGSGSTKELCYFTGCTSATLSRLEKMGYLQLEEVPVYRRAVSDTASKPQELLQLSEEQRLVYHGLCSQQDREVPGAALLYGVTGSGKTAVYLHLIDRCLKAGKGAMLLVPEIGLTPQLLQLFSSHFGDQVAVLHSGLHIGERYDEWKRVRSGEAKLVIGTRSAVFAPVHELHLLIVDEEQEHSYKSENTPRYHARDVALFRGMRERALVLLGSATPSVESMYHAERGEYQLYKLPQRFNGKVLPSVQIVDMKQELKSGNAGSISAPLRERIAENIQKKQQTILFLNRRGTSRYVICVDCGAVPQCPRCSVNMTYHAANGRLMCHQCGHSEPLPNMCPECGGTLKPVGIGTQKVVEELDGLFPGTRILRMDADTVSAVNNHEKLLSQFEAEQIPIMIGTQMVAKGLNFKNVTLVGVLDADMSLYFDSFRAAESTFSMLTQVIGRSGRGAEEGAAMIQTMTPEHAVIQLAAEQNYDRFYQMEIELRRLCNCYPYRDMFVFTFSGIYEERVLAGACYFRDQLSQMLQSQSYQSIAASILGPAPAIIAKVNHRYRYRLTLSCTGSRPLRQTLSGLMQSFMKDKRNKGVAVFADVNPYD